MSSSRVLLTLLFLVSGVSSSIGQKSFQAGFWNIENLFDTTNALNINDDDFTPTGRNEWTEERILDKMKRISHVIKDMNKNDDLAVLGLAEIENFQILERLNNDFINQGFKIVHKESPDERGIDCALIYNPEIIELVDKNFIAVNLAGIEKTRDIVEAEFTMSNAGSNSSLIVFINHWPSRWGGKEKTDPLRRSAALTLRTRIDHILLKNPKADIIVMGDFNDYPDDPSLNKILRAGPFRSDHFPGDLFNTSWDLNLDPDAGTCMYRGTWVVLDQIIISYGMLDNINYNIMSGSSKPFLKDYLIESKGKYAGWPFRMFRSGQYQGGYSDHLPISCRVAYN